MGLYINPPNMEKEQWLDENATPYGDDFEKVREVARNDDLVLPVVWINNGPFTAAGIAYDERELNSFQNGISGRPFRLFTAPVDRLNSLPGIKVKGW